MKIKQAMQLIPHQLQSRAEKLKMRYEFWCEKAVVAAVWDVGFRMKATGVPRVSRLPI